MSAEYYTELKNEDFLKVIYSDAPEDGIPAVCGFPNWSKPNWRALPFHGEHLSPLINPESDTFYSIGAVLNQQQFRRSKDAFVSLQCLMFDDVQPEDMPVQPTLSLETSPGNYQIGIKIEAITDYNLADRLYRALVKKGSIKADQGGCNVVRYARLPEGTNTKPKCGTGGFKHIVHEWNPEIIYSVEEIIEGFELNLEEVEARPDIVYDIKPEDDPYFNKLQELGMVKYSTDVNKFEVKCLWMDEHTDKKDDGAFYDSARNKFHCNHNHMELRKRYGDLHTFTYYMK